MKPPICSICHEKCFSNGKLIYFKESETDKISNAKFKRKGFVGHPKNAVWFCEEHYKIAKEHKHLTKFEAITLIKENLK